MLALTQLWRVLGARRHQQQLVLPRCNLSRVRESSTPAKCIINLPVFVQRNSLSTDLVTAILLIIVDGKIHLVFGIAQPQNSSEELFYIGYWLGDEYGNANRWKGVMFTRLLLHTALCASRLAVVLIGYVVAKPIELCLTGAVAMNNYWVSVVQCVVDLKFTRLRMNSLGINVTSAFPSSSSNSSWMCSATPLRLRNMRDSL